MEENPFENNELCDGECCVIRYDCARYMGNVDLHRVNPYVVFNRKPCPTVCPWFITFPDERYPHKDSDNR